MGNLFFDEPAGYKPPRKFKTGDWVIWELEFTILSVTSEFHSAANIYKIGADTGGRYEMLRYHDEHSLGAHLYEDIDPIYRLWEGAMQDGKPLLRRARG